uniref:Homologous recombination OB-fold protein OB-fold domain-containing protein n=1 Tax=Tanacetum cinerariifolium TaxID=118510 RepID=A0A6L2NT94_TANCI|nr:hypothetical protein [Tanacetum cinerariifolium]
MYDVVESFGRLDLYLNHLDTDLSEYVGQTDATEMDACVSKTKGPPKKSDDDSDNDSNKPVGYLSLGKEELIKLRYMVKANREKKAKDWSYGKKVVEKYGKRPPKLSGPGKVKQRKQNRIREEKIEEKMFARGEEYKGQEGVLFEEGLSEEEFRLRDGLKMKRKNGKQMIRRMCYKKYGIEVLSGEAWEFLGALLDSSKALSSSEARGFVLDTLRCVLADSLTVALGGLYVNEHPEVLCVQYQRLGSGREMGYTIKEFDLDIDDFDLHLTPVLRSSSSTRVEPSPLTPNPVRIIPGPAGIIQLSSSTRVEPSPSTPNLVRIIPGHAGTIPGTISHKVIDEGGYRNDITVGDDIILANVSVFTLKPSMHYLNITMRNVVKVFRKDTFPESGSS